MRVKPALKTEIASLAAALTLLMSVVPLVVFSKETSVSKETSDSNGTSVSKKTSVSKASPFNISYLPPNVDLKNLTEQERGKVFAHGLNEFKRNPQNYEAQYNHLLMDRFKNGREHSKALANRMLKENPKWFSPLFYLAMESRVALDDEAELAWLNKCLQVNTNFYGGYAVRSDLLRNMGREKEALADLNKAIELHPGNKEFLRGSRARIYFNLKEYDKCIADSMPGIDRFPGDPNTTTVIRAYRAKNDWSGMAAFLDKHRYLEKTAQGAFARAEVCYANAQYEKALAACSSCIQLAEPHKDGVTDPKFLTEVLALRAKVYRKLGKQDLAAADEKRVKSEVYDDIMFQTK